MDLRPFSEDVFDEVEWVNSVFCSPGPGANHEALASSLVMKLQLCIHEINNAVEETANQVLQSLPRVVRDVEALTQEVSVFQQKLRLVKDEITEVEKGTAGSMESLVSLEDMKTKVQAANKALKEADNWTTLLVDVEELFESGNIEALAQRLNNLAQSLTLLGHVSDYQNRVLQLEGFRNRLEALASPRLVSALGAGNPEQCKFFVEMFNDMGRLPQLYKYYHRCRKSALVQKWKLLLENDEECIIDWVNQYYVFLVNDFHDQMRWMQQVLPTTIPKSHLLIDVYADVLTSLDPSPGYCAEAWLKQQEDRLQGLELWGEAIQRAASKMEQAFKSVDEDLMVSKHQALAAAIYLPFKSQLSKYGSYELEFFTRYLTSLPNFSSSSQESLSTIVQLLSRSINQALNCVREAVKRCQKLTRGIGFPAVINAIKDFFTRYLDRFRTVLTCLEQAAGEEWTRLHNCLSFVQITGELLLQLDNLESTLVANVQSNSRKLLQENLKPFQDFPRLLSDDQNTFNVKQCLERANQGKLLVEVDEQASTLTADAQKTTYDVLFQPIQIQLNLLNALDLRNTAGASLTPDLPSFSLSPQEYITQIGQYLMMLPQHMEPFLLNENPALYRAFRQLAFPHSQSNDVTIDMVSAADFVLPCLARGTAIVLVERMLQIPSLSAPGAKQLAADISYFGNILEDLGLSLLETLMHLKELFQNSGTVAEFRVASMGKPARYVTAVRAMRNLPSLD